MVVRKVYREGGKSLARSPRQGLQLPNTFIDVY